MGNNLILLLGDSRPQVFTRAIVLKQTFKVIYNLYWDFYTPWSDIYVTSILDQSDKINNCLKIYIFCALKSIAEDYEIMVKGSMKFFTIFVH